MLRNKIVMITGASSGIGAATAMQFAQLGAKLLLCARNIDKLTAVAKQIEAETKTPIHTFPLDVRQQPAVIKSINDLPPAWREVEVLVNSAGLAAGLDTFQEGLTSDWDEMLDTNVKGLLYVTKAILPQMIERNSGHIINIGSVAGHTVYPKGAVYCASKAAVKSITEGLRMDLFGKKIRVTTIDPGAVDTNFSTIRFKGDAARAAEVYKGMEPLTAHDIADTIVYCATRPPHVNICEVIMMPTDQASATMIARKN